MGWLKRFFGGKSGAAGGSERGPADSPEPFMEHPSGQLDSAVAAMEDAVRRLRELPDWQQWITFGAQGQGPRGDGYAFAEVRMRGDQLDAGERPLDIARIVQAAATPPASFVADGPHYSIAAAAPREVARLLDTIFRHHLGIRPFPDEKDDYAVGAEW